MSKFKVHVLTIVTVEASSFGQASAMVEKELEPNEYSDNVDGVDYFEITSIHKIDED